MPMVSQSAIRPSDGLMAAAPATMTFGPHSLKYFHATKVVKTIFTTLISCCLKQVGRSPTMVGSVAGWNWGVMGLVL